MRNRLLVDKKKKERLASFWLRRNGAERINRTLICSANNERGKAYSENRLLFGFVLNNIMRE